ncbi:MAG: VWA domain-containing protein [Acidobacteria bacterium]|nr:VWA domain-containing protein [Acidobacteriota bacterium]
MPRLSQRALAGALLLWFSCRMAVGAETAEQSPDSSENRPGFEAPPLTVRSNLVLVPVLVKDKAGEPIFSLTADDFVLTDNGIPQSLRLEADTDLLPLALAVIVERGGQGAFHLRDYRHLGPVLDAVIGNVPHRVAVVGFDSKPRLARDFTPDTDAAAETIATLPKGDRGAAILDALAFGIDLLRNQPPAYRRAVLLFSETIDRGSKTSLEDAIRAVDDTNTAIYSFAFSSTKQAVKHEASKLPGGSYSDTPYPPGGCMSQDPNADPDAYGKRGVQALNCASDLVPPLRIARMAFLAARDGFKRNVPESVAKLTGGEYFGFDNAAALKDRLITISNDVPNYYVLSFRPKSPDPGLHALELRLKDKPQLKASARKAYWVDDGRNVSIR